MGILYRDIKQHFSKYLVLAAWFSVTIFCYSQDKDENQVKFEGDFRFRVEQDWNVRKPDGSYKEDRSRLRIRARAGLVYRPEDWSEFGFRLRTGDPAKQQDPQITLGDQFSGLPISFERAYAGFNVKRFSGWLGKNYFPFEKQNELFWSDNVFPEGIAAGIDLPIETSWLNLLRLNAGHFVFIANNAGFNKDSYIQGLQLKTEMADGKFVFFPGFFFFHQMPDIPDGNQNYYINYSIVHLGSRFYLKRDPKWTLELDYYHNIQDLAANDSIPAEFVNQKKGITASSSYGHLKDRGNWLFRISYNYQERYSAVDFIAQNDWARWDYSEAGSADGRLTNYKGWEFLIAYAITEKMDVQLRSFFVEQLVPLGNFRETNSRARLDLNIKF